MVRIITTGLKTVSCLADLLGAVWPVGPAAVAAGTDRGKGITLLFLFVSRDQSERWGLASLQVSLLALQCTWLLYVSPAVNVRWPHSAQYNESSVTGGLIHTRMSHKVSGTNRHTTEQYCWCSSMMQIVTHSAYLALSLPSRRMQILLCPNLLYSSHPYSSSSIRHLPSPTIYLFLCSPTSRFAFC